MTLETASVIAFIISAACAGYGVGTLATDKLKRQLKEANKRAAEMQADLTAMVRERGSCVWPRAEASRESLGGLTAVKKEDE